MIDMNNPYPEYSVEWVYAKALYKFRYEAALKLVGEALV